MIMPVVAALTLALGISVFFGCLQLFLGVVLLRRLVQGWRWRVRSITLGALVGAWLLVGGGSELSVATSEVLHGSGAVTTHLRATVDVILLVTTLVLMGVLLGYLLALRLLPAPE